MADTGGLPDDFLPLLDELNAIVARSGDLLEGNVFYHHHEPNPGRGNIVDYFRAKRHNYATICKAATCMLEIGVNGGHSALLALANGIEYHGIDICWHPYTKPAAAFLKSTFGDRFHFYEGDSLKVIPTLPELYPFLRFDLLHIDGLHTLEQCKADTENSIALALQNAWVMIDDTDMPDIRGYFDLQVQNGTLKPIRPEGWIDNPHHDVGRL
jgi:hypothetical protein